ncbi:hypothetical protein LIER_42243 [Lithospermum erythrorhizon]|uniref:Uncharacterized protein n=1 Tax=Lithospermum erythrorhizon TaxID=34254 RepID=A0AAV3RRM8_LITER
MIQDRGCASPALVAPRQCSGTVQFRNILQDRERMVRTLNQIRPEAISAQIQELQEEIRRLEEQLQVAEEQLRVFEPDPEKITSMEERQGCEKHLEELLAVIIQRKMSISGSCGQAFPSYSSCNNEIANLFPDYDNGQNPLQVFDTNNGGYMENVPSMCASLFGEGSSSNMMNPAYITTEYHVGQVPIEENNKQLEESFQHIN